MQSATLNTLLAAGLVSAALLAGGAIAAEGSGTGYAERLEGHGGPVKSVRVDAAGKRAITASFDYSAMVWSLEGSGADGKGALLFRLLGHDAAVNDAAFLPRREGEPWRAVSVSDDSNLIIWDVEKETVLHRHEGNGDKVVDVAVSDDGRLAAAARWDGSVLVYDLDAGSDPVRFTGHRGNVNAVAFAPDGGYVVSGGFDGDIRVWSTAGAARIGDLQHGSIVHSAGWGVNVLAPLDGERYAFGTINGTIGIVEPQTGDVQTLIAEGHPVLALAHDPIAGRLAAGSADGHIRVYSTLNLALIEDYDDPYGPVWGLAFADGGKRLYRAGLDDFVSQWQVTPRKLFELPPGEFPRRFQVSEGTDIGEAEFQRKCSVCHTLSPDDANRAGPTLHGVFGRVAGSLPGYPYSPALKESDIVWNEETIALLFDKGPDVVTPGSKMPVQRLKSIERREALVAFLKRATAPGSGAGSDGSTEGQ